MKRILRQLSRRTGVWRLIIICGFFTDLNYRTNAQVNFQITTNHYFIAIDTLKEILYPINRPFRTNLNFLAYTKWVVNWNVQTDFIDGFYKVGGIQITTKVTITMPSYKPATNGIPQDNFLKRWAVYYNRLLEHEMGHVRIAKEASKKVYSNISRLSPKVGKNELLSLIDQTAKKNVDEFKKQEAEYDKKTQHGLQQIRNN